MYVHLPEKSALLLRSITAVVETNADPVTYTPLLKNHVLMIYTIKMNLEIFWKEIVKVALVTKTLE